MSANGPRIRFPETRDALPQDEEFFEVLQGGRWRRMRVHDYAEMFRVPGLYEALVYDELQCTSPARLVGLFGQVLEDWPECPGDLRVLDLGAGNGIVAEELKRAGARVIVGIDLLPEARAAAERDRPGLYDDYVVADLTALPDADRRRLSLHRPNALTSVAALGFGDIPADAFGVAYNLVAADGWIAFTIKDAFLGQRDASGFSKLIRWMIDSGVMEVQAHRRFCHRLSIQRKQLFYVGVIARKQRDIPREVLDVLASRKAPRALSTLMVGAGA